MVDPEHLSEGAANYAKITSKKLYEIEEILVRGRWGALGEPFRSATDDENPLTSI